MREGFARLFGRWGATVVARPWPVLLIALVTVAALGSRIPELEVDTSTEGFLRADDPTLVTYDRFRERFGRDDFIVIGIETTDVFTFGFLERLRAFHRALESRVPHVDEITSLVNARWSRGEDGQLIVEDFMERAPRTPQELVELRRRALGNPLYIDNIVTADAKLTTVLIDLEAFVQDGVDESGVPVLRYLTGPEQREVVEVIERIIGDHTGDDFRPHAAGVPLMADRIAYRMIQDLPTLVSRALLVMGALLFLLFGKLRAVLLPLTVIVLSLVSTIGLMAHLAIPYQVPTQIVPLSLLAIGVGDSVHLLAIYYQHRRAGAPREQALPAAFEHAGPALLMTSLTTAAALLSFLSAALAPVANVGIVLPVGVMIAFVLTVTVLPALLILLPERSLPAHRRLAWLDRAVVALGTLSARYPRPVLIAAAVAMVVALTGLVQVEFSHDPVRWFPPGDAFREATDTLNETLGGVVALEVLFETDEIDGVKDPEFLSALDAVAAANGGYADRWREGQGADSRAQLRVAKTIALTDLLKEIHRALNDDDPAFYALPSERDLVAQELLLFELSGNDDLEDLVDYEYTTARMTLRLPWADAMSYGGFIDGLIGEQRERVGGDVRVVPTGRAALLTRTFSAVVDSMIRSYIFAFAAVAPLMMILLGSFRLGAISMIPNIIPIVAALGLMGWTGMPLDAFSLLTGSIALGLAVDDTIHFMYGFRREYARSGDAVDAVRITLATTGQALFFTTAILCAGFLLYTTGYMLNARNFGIVTAFALAVAFLSDIVIGPALVVLVSRAQTTRSGADVRPGV